METSLVGTVLKHRYEIIQSIGEGSLFTVYKAEDKIENRIVAIKVLRAEYASNSMFLERLVVAAQAFIGLRHPNIVEVYDAGSENGICFVVVEYVQGLDLKERIRRSAPLALSAVVDLGMVICDALEYAHRRGFVHGDLRSENVFITDEGHIKVADFWVYDAVASSQTMRTNAMMRSVHYTAPEVAEGEDATPAADVYSLGIMLYEALTGALPFDGDTPITVALKHAKEPIPSVRAANPGVPKQLELVITKALQKQPYQRYRSAKAMFNELKNVREALNLSKPLVWSSVGEKKSSPATEEVVVEEERDVVVLSTLVKTLTVTVILIALVFLGVVIYVWTGPDEVEVPQLIGKSLSEAREITKARHIELNVRAEEYNEKYDEGVIYFMNPPAGRHIKEGKFVDVWVSKGSRYASVPSLVRLTEDEARRRVTDTGLVVGVVSQDYSDAVPAGSVMSQNPAAGTRVEKGRPVNFVVSLGPKFEEQNVLTPSEEPQPQMPEAQTQAQSEPRSFDVIVNEVPPGPQNQLVEIVVEDDLGKRTVFTQVAHPGDRVSHTVQGVGKQVIIRVYIDGKLVKEDVR